MAKKDSSKEPEEEHAKKKGSKKKILVPILLVVVLGGGVYYMKFMKKPPHHVAGSAPAGPITVENSLTVNLRDGHYLQFTAGIQTYAGKSDKILTTDQAVVLNVLNAQAAQMTEPQLLLPSGPARLKAAIVASLDKYFPGLVQAVYFEQFVMQ